MPWPELYEAKKKANEISVEIEKLLKEHNGLLKKEIAKHSEKLLSETNDAIDIVKERIKELQKNLENHKKQLLTKSSFLKRHNSRNKY